MTICTGYGTRMVPIERGLSMPRRKPPVKVSYTKARTTPSERVKREETESAKPQKKKHTLYSYIAENEESGLPVQELIHQFQEYDCDHKEEEVISATSKVQMLRCKSCRRIRSQRRAGVLKHEA